MSLSIEVSPTRPLIDDLVAIRVDGAMPGDQVRIRGEIDGGAWASDAVFEATGHGQVDTTRQAASGSYEGCDPMGLFWSMVPRDPTEPQWSRSSLAPVEVRITATTATTSATVEFPRLLVGEGVRRTEIAEPDLTGTLFEPPDGGTTATLVLGGSEGGIPEGVAALLASRGFTALALGYLGRRFGSPELIEVPLERIGTAIEWLSDRSPAGVALLGASRGGELALLAGATFPQVAAVVAFSASGLVHAGISRKWWRRSRSAWTLESKPLPFAVARMPTSTRWRFMGQAMLGFQRPISLRSHYARVLKDDKQLARARIAVERIRGPVQLFSGEDDQLWPATDLSELAIVRLRESNHPLDYEHHRYPGAGHLIGVPFLPTTRPVVAYRGGVRLACGGSPAATAAASQDAWRRALSLLQRLSDEAGVPRGRGVTRVKPTASGRERAPGGPDG